MFTLRYSATHKQLYHQIYKLDSYDAYQNDLVKKSLLRRLTLLFQKICHLFVMLSLQAIYMPELKFFTRARWLYKIQKFKVRGGDNLFDLSGGLSQYQNIRIHEDPHKLKPLKLHLVQILESYPLGNQQMMCLMKTQCVFKFN